MMIQTRYGQYQGLEQGKVRIYLGIPYAKAPVGDRRWKAPVELDESDSVFLADHFPCKAPQLNHQSPPYDKDFYDDPRFNGVISEDCLYLNIWAPKEAQNAPVAVWIHGGAFDHGSASEKEFDGAAFAERGVIFVSIQYRLGILGFLAHPWLTAEAGTSGNYGLLDQIQALKWIQENIHAFGGDPKQVTIFGQSAGAMSVQTLISSPMTDGLFSKAILQSGGSYREGLHRDLYLSQAEEYGKIYTELMGYSSLEEMRSKCMEEILESYPALMEKVFPIAKGLFLVPIIDGKLMTEGYYEVLDHQKQKKIPYMVGSTKDDIFVTKDSQRREESLLHRGSVAFAQKCNEEDSHASYVYYFKRNLPGDDFGAWHSSELWYMMGTMERCWRPWTAEDLQLSRDMLDYWTNFVKYGNPNGDHLPKWSPCTSEDAFVMDFDV